MAVRKPSHTVNWKHISTLEPVSEERLQTLCPSRHFLQSLSIAPEKQVRIAWYGTEICSDIVNVLY